jgi:hypothetical protein
MEQLKGFVQDQNKRLVRCLREFFLIFHTIEFML